MLAAVLLYSGAFPAAAPLVVLCFLDLEKVFKNTKPPYFVSDRVAVASTLLIIAVSFIICTNRRDRLLLSSYTITAVVLILSLLRSIHCCRQKKEQPTRELCASGNKK